MAEPSGTPNLATFAPPMPAPGIPDDLVTPAMPVPLPEPQPAPSMVPEDLVTAAPAMPTMAMPPELVAAGAAGEARAGVERAAERPVDVAPAQSAGERVAQFGEQKRALTAKLAEIAGKAALIDDPAELGKLRQEYERAQAGLAMVDQQLGQARGESDRATEVLSGQVADKQRQLEQAGLAQAEAEAELLTTEAEAQTQKLRNEQTAVAERHEREKAEYRDLLERGPETKSSDWISAVGRVIGEGLDAAVDQRTPSFDRIFADLDRAVERRFRGHVAAATQAITDTGDALGDLAARQKEVEASRAAGEAAVRRKVAADIRLQADQAAEPIRKIMLQRMAEDVDRRAEAKEAEAMAARAEQQRKARMDEAKLAGIEAKTTLTRAQTAKALADAQKAARRARGKGRERGVTVDPQLAKLGPKERARVEEQGVRNPYTGEYIKLSGAPDKFFTAPERKVAEAVQSRVIATTDFLAVGSEMADVMARAGWELDALASKDWQQIKVLQTKLTTIIKSSEQLGALDAGALEFAKAFTTAGLNASGFRSALPALRKSMEVQAASANRELTGRGGTAIRFPLPTLERDPLSAAQRSAGASVNRGDQTGRPSGHDVRGEADSARKTAALMRSHVEQSTKAVRLLAQSGGALRMAGRGGVAATRAPGVQQIAEKALGSEPLTTAEERKLVAAVEGINPGLRGQVFVGAKGRANQRAIARAQDRKAAAITLAQEWFQDNKPIEQFRTSRLAQSGRIDGLDMDNPRELADFRRRFRAEYERVSGAKLKGKSRPSRKRAMETPTLDLSSLAR